MINIWVNGCFDIIHSGHIDLLKYAKSFGDNLIVGLDCDERIRNSKGENRPILPLDERMKIISSISYVDKVVSFNDNDELKSHIKNNNISIIVVGEDYINKEVIGREFSKEIYFFPKLEGKSTTNIIDKILNE